MIYWIRHCSTTGQAPEAPLTAAGFAQAERLADQLDGRGITRIVSSPYRRAIQSIEPFAARTGIKLETDHRLRERVLSTEAIEDWKPLLQRTFDEPDFAARGGESSRAALQRATDLLHEIRASGLTTAIISHGNLTALALRALGYPMDFDASLRLTNPDVFQIAGGFTPTVTRLRSEGS